MDFREAGAPKTRAIPRIDLATREDIAGILDLQERNLPTHGGTLSGPISREWFEAAMFKMPIIVARRDGLVVGYVVSSSLAAHAYSPIIRGMLRAYRGSDDAYNYGPICVAEGERCRGLAGEMSYLG
jgi:hypothetical protein